MLRHSFLRVGKIFPCSIFCSPNAALTLLLLIELHLLLACQPELAREAINAKNMTALDWVMWIFSFSYICYLPTRFACRGINTFGNTKPQLFIFTMINLPTYVYYKFLGTPPITTSMQRDAYFSCILPNNKDGTFYKMMSHLTIPNYKRCIQ